MARRGRPRKGEERAARLARSARTLGAPVTRADCAGVPRPCPWVACRHNLGVDHPPGEVGWRDVIRETARGPGDSCSLDLADSGGATLDQVGARLGLTRERIRQIEVRGLLKVRLAIGQHFDPRELRGIFAKKGDS